MSEKINQRKYQFHWELPGDLQLGRPNLGNTTRLEVYRLYLQGQRGRLLVHR